MSLTESKFAKECKIGMKWRIKEDFLKEAMKKIDDKAVKSSLFSASNIPGVEYCLKLESDEDDPNEINILLRLNFKMVEKIDAAFTISVRSALFENYSEEHYDKSEGCGVTLCTRDELFDPQRNFFVDGYMEIELDGNLQLRGGIKRKASGPLSLSQLLFDRDDKDLTIVVGDEQVKIHKWIITANSPVFRAEMESGLKEAQENKITITDFKFETVNIFVEYCYERDIATLITKENASELLRFSDKYNIESLHNSVQTLLIDKLSDANVCEFANLSITSNARELRECCICFLMKFVGKSTLVEGFEKLDKEITSEIGRRSFLSSSFSE